MVANQLRTKLDLDHARQVITISRGLRRLGRLVVDRVKYTYLGIKPSFSLSGEPKCPRLGGKVSGFSVACRMSGCEMSEFRAKSYARNFARSTRDCYVMSI